MGPRSTGEVALSLGTLASIKGMRLLIFDQRTFGFTRKRWKGCMLVPLEAALERNCAVLKSGRLELTRLRLPDLLDLDL